MTISDLKLRFKLVRYFAEEIGMIMIVPGALVTIAVLLYLFSPQGGRSPREFTGKIVDKRGKYRLDLFTDAEWRERSP